MVKWKNESGQVLVVVALSTTVLMGFVAFATDVGLMLRQRRMAQTVADAAAVAAATESLNEGTPSTVTSGMWSVAYHDAVMNGFTPGASNGTANSSTGVTLTLNVNPNIGISGYNSAGYVQAVVTLNTQTVFMNMFGVHSMNVSATAIASDALTSDFCFNDQNAGGLANPAVNMGGNSLIAAGNCVVTVNGNLSITGSGSINAKAVAVSGTYSGAGGSNWSEGNPPQSDPLSRLQKTANQPQVSNNACTAPSGSGMSCAYDFGCGSSSCTLSNVTLSSNTVYYYDKPISVSGSVKGSGVTLYLAGNIPFDFDSNGSATITPPGYGSSCIGSSNPLCGILIDAPTDGSAGAGTYTCSSGKGNNKGNPGEIYLDFGSSTTDLEGVIYAPSMQLYGQDKGSSTTFDSNLVIGNVCMQSATFKVNGYSGPQSPVTRVGLVY